MDPTRQIYVAVAVAKAKDEVESIVQRVKEMMRRGSREECGGKSQGGRFSTKKEGGNGKGVTGCAGLAHVVCDFTTIA